MKAFIEMKQVFKDTSRLFRLVWKGEQNLILLSTVAVFFTSILPFTQSYLLGLLTDRLVKQDGKSILSSGILNFTILALMAGSCFAVANVLQYYLKTKLHKNLHAFFSKTITQTIADLSVVIHENPLFKDIITKVQENAMDRAPDFMQRMTFLVQNLLEVLFATCIFMSAGWHLGFTILVAAMPRLFIDLWYNNNLWLVETLLAETKRKFWYARWFLYEIKALSEVKLYQNQKFFSDKVSSHLDAIKEKEMEVEHKNLHAQLSSLIISECAAACIVVVLVMRVVHGEMLVGTLMFYLASLQAFRTSLNSLSQNIGSQFRDNKFVRDMFEVFDLQQENPVTNGHIKSGLDEIYSIVFENVSFMYPGTSKLILKNFNLSIAKGEAVAIVGENGKGKSTLAKLLSRTYHPTSGRILINGIDLRDFDSDYWQSNVGVMLQNYSNYEHLTVETAIGLGRSDIGNSCRDARVLAAVEAAQALGFINELPGRFKTTLGRAFENGIELSVGQYQMLAVARMFFRKPLLAIFDEPTSAIDAPAESKIFDRILEEKNSIRILISHRFYAIRRVDKICYIEDGAVAELGTHEELMKRGGKYAASFKLQAEKYGPV